MSDELEKQLAIMKSNYLLALPDKISEIKDFWLAASSIDDESALGELHRKAHSLAGSGATFGQESMSKVAKSLELFVKDHIESQDIFAENNVMEVNLLIDKLSESIVHNDESPSEEAPPSNSQTAAKESPYKNIDENLKVGRMRILLADDDKDNRDRLKLILSDSGHEVFIAIDGRDAVEKAIEVGPDIILMDVVMPNMTGYDAAKKIRIELVDKFIPILFLTAITDNESLARCISAGGDDFINKPVHPLILNAKLAAFQRIIGMYVKLDEYQKTHEEEMQASKEVMDSVIFRNDIDIDGLESWAKSPGHFSGDTRLFTKLDNGRVYILLCDFTGHGLPAAIGTVFVSDLFRSMTSKKIPAIDILSEINSKMNQILPTGRYCAAIMIDYDPPKKTMKMWNCGLPGAYLTDENHKIVKEFSSQNVPLGVLSGKITAEPYEINVTGKSEIILFSDGITEAENPNGEMYGDEKLVSFIENLSPEQDVFSSVKEELESFMDGEEPTDDISLIVQRFK